MKSFVIVINDRKGVPIHTQIVSVYTTANLCVPTIQGPFDKEADAENYENQLRTIFNLPGYTRANRRKLGQRKPVKCWQTGQIFPSASKAAEAIGVSTSAITQHIKDPATRSSVRGYTFSWA